MELEHERMLHLPVSAPAMFCRFLYIPAICFLTQTTNLQDFQNTEDISLKTYCCKTIRHWLQYVKKQRGMINHIARRAFVYILQFLFTIDAWCHLEATKMTAFGSWRQPRKINQPYAPSLVRSSKQRNATPNAKEIIWVIYHKWRKQTRALHCGWSCLYKLSDSGSRLAATLALLVVY